MQNLQMLRALVPNQIFSENLIQNGFNQLTQEKKDAYSIRAAQSRIRELSHIPLCRQALDLAYINPERISRRFFEKRNLISILEDVNQLAISLAPRIHLSREPFSENTIENIDDFPVKAVLLMGNNDGKYINNFVEIFKRLRDNSSIKIFIMGFGGYGTTAGPIFYYPEALTFAERLYDLGIPRHQIVIEANSTTSEQNIRCLNKLLQRNSSPENFLIMGTPMATLRQYRMLEKLASFPWNNIYTFPTNDFHDYFSTEDDALMNMLFILREFMGVTFWHISKRSSISTRPLENQMIFRENFKLVCGYYETISAKAIDFDQNEFMDDFFHFMEIAHLEEDNAEACELKFKLIERITPICNEFRVYYEWLAKFHMPRLSPKLPFVEHAHRLNELHNRSLNALDLRKPHAHSPWQSAYPSSRERKFQR